MRKKEYEDVNYKGFAKEIKLLVRAAGNSNFILLSEVEELIVRFNINLGELQNICEFCGEELKLYYEEKKNRDYTVKFCESCSPS